MRVRWLRIAGAAGLVAAGTPAIGIGAMWLTAPAPSPVERAMPGADDCSTDEVLEAGLPLRATLEGNAESGRLSADLLLAAARCAAMEEGDWERLFEVFE